MTKTALICGSIAFDKIMQYQGRFGETLLADQLHRVNVSFLVPTLRTEFGGCSVNIAYNLQMLGGDPLIMGTIGQDGGDYLERNLECLKLNGRLVQIGLIGGSRASLSLTAVLQRRLTITGSTLRVRTPAEKGAIAAALLSEVWPRIEAGEVRPVVYRTFPLARAADAHRMLESGEVIGKVVLTVQ